MAILRKKDIKTMQEKEITSKLEDLRLELLKANTQKSGKQAGKMGEIRKTIARLLTKLNQNKTLQDKTAEKLPEKNKNNKEKKAEDKKK